MSGGVDSSVAAFLLKKRGYQVTGVFMRCYNLDGCSEKDAIDARRVAAKLEIPFYVFDFKEEYKRGVVDYMVEGYRAGLTPNPDVMCNKQIKFGLFLEKALLLGADYIATGHYVRKIGDSLFAAKDKNKDQSYFLWTLAQNQIKHCLFPIGGYEKNQVRKIAQKAGLPTAQKKDSQGICFLGKVTLADFLKGYIPEERGTVLNVAGQKIGEHGGSHFYTIGQRHIGVSSNEPKYVVQKDVVSNTVILGSANDPALYKDNLELKDINLLTWKNVKDILVRVRYRQSLAKAKLIGKKLIFQKPVRFVAAGQSAVFYSKRGELIGGGVIE